MTKEKEKTPQIFTVRILGPTRNLYDGDAISVSARNKQGQFDVLYNHQNFFSVLDECQVVVNTGEQNMTFPINQGLLKVHSNVATLFVDIDQGYKAKTEH